MFVDNILLTFKTNTLPTQYYTPHGLPDKRLEPGVCSVCGNKLLIEIDEYGDDDEVTPLNAPGEDSTVELWSLVG